jgi:hypothetical protein
MKNQLVNTLAFHHLGTITVGYKICLWIHALYRFVMFMEDYLYTLKNDTGESGTSDVKVVIYNCISIYLFCLFQL